MYRSELPDPRPWPPSENPDAALVLGIDQLEAYGYPQDWGRPEGEVSLKSSIDEAMESNRSYVPGWRDGPPVMVSRSSLERLNRPGDLPDLYVDSGHGCEFVASGGTYQGHPVMHLVRLDRLPPPRGETPVPLSQRVYVPEDVPR